MVYTKLSTIYYRVYKKDFLLFTKLTLVPTFQSDLGPHFQVNVDVKTVQMQNKTSRNLKSI